MHIITCIYKVLYNKLKTSMEAALAVASEKRRLLLNIQLALQVQSTHIYIYIKNTKLVFKKMHMKVNTAC